MLRVLAVVLLVDLFAFVVWSLPSLRTTSWSSTSLFMFGVAGLCVVWVGYWIVYSRTRLEGDVLTQTWLWNKRVRAQDVAQLKLVHIRLLESVITPRMLVRRRFGGITWFQAYDPQVLIAFGQQVALWSIPANHQHLHTQCPTVDKHRSCTPAMTLHRGGLDRAVVDAGVPTRVQGLRR